MPRDAVPCLLGPTASGKSEVAEVLARRTAGEIIACDAFTIYRGMAILTAAPKTGGDVPHHLIAELEPSEAWSAAAFVAACDARIDDIRRRGRVPWVVGGTALYLRAWLKGFGARVPRDESYRRELRAIARARGRAALHDELARVDPPRAAELHPNDLRRVVRALEIVRATGRPASAQREEWSGPDRRPAVLYGLRRETDDLDGRIGRRTDRMFQAGVVEEVRALLARPPSAEAGKVLGLSTIAAHLGGELDEAAAREEIARRTRRFARKQRTFFRSFPGVRWVDVPADESAERTAERVLDSYGATSR